MSSQPNGHRGAFFGALVVLGILSLLPARWNRWTGWLGDVAGRVAAPASSPAKSIAQLFSGEPGGLNHEMMSQLEHERDHFKLLWLQEQRRSQDLVQTIEQLQKGAMYGDVPFKPVVCQVIGGSSDGTGGMLLVRAGSVEGVTEKCVATTAGVQVIGQVVRVDGRTSWVRVITHPAAGKVRGVIMGSDDKPGPACELSPHKSRPILQGLVEYVKDPKQAPAIGQTVRVDDPIWPRSSRMLVLGTITDMKPAPAGSRQMIEVTPTVPLDRLSELVLRATLPDTETPALPLPSFSSPKTGKGKS